MKSDWRLPSCSSREPLTTSSEQHQLLAATRARSARLLGETDPGKHLQRFARCIKVLNQQLRDQSVWNTVAIEMRGKDLAEKSLVVWRPLVVDNGPFGLRVTLPLPTSLPTKNTGFKRTNADTRSQNLLAVRGVVGD